MAHVNPITFYSRYKKAFVLTTQQDDYRILQMLFQIGKYALATCAQPIAKFSTAKKLCLILLLVIYFAKIVTSFSSESNITSTMIKLGSVTDAMFVSCFIYNGRLKSKGTWSALYDDLRRLEQVMETLRFIPTTTKWYIASRISMIWGGFLLIMFYQLWIWIRSEIMYQFYVTYAWLITNFYFAILLSYVLFAMRFLKTRYDFVETEIVSMTQEDAEFVLDKIKLVTKFLDTAYGIMDRLNYLLGLQFFAFINTTVASWVAVYCYQLYVTEDALDMKLTAICSILPQLWLLVKMVMSCDAVEQCGINVVQACYKLHHQTKNEKLRRRILMLATYAEEWRPIFSAAGFYDVNQKCLNSIFSASINYLVIIIQFNMMVSPPRRINQSM